ncbi:MAG: YggT family protein [Deltaproteobacteria bacterium]|nr:YggT family protein [Deltaproteobacteria bacterium]
MSFLAHVILAIGKILTLFIDIYTLIVIVAALMSWVSPDPYNPIVRTLHSLTAPVFHRVRRLLPRKIMEIPIDITPLIVLVLLAVLEGVIKAFLQSTARTFLQ